MKVKNMIISEKGVNTLVYCNTLSPEELSKWYKKVIGVEPTDVYQVKNEEIQYHLIDGRVWCDTEEKEAMVRMQIGKIPVSCYL